MLHSPSEAPQKHWDPIPHSPSSLMTTLFTGFPSFFVSQPHHLTVLSGTSCQRNYWCSNPYLRFSFWQKSSMLIISGYHNKRALTEWLKQQIFIFSEFWKLEVPSQDVLMDWIVSSPSTNSYAEASTPNMTVFGDRASEKVIRIKWIIRVGINPIGLVSL